MLYIFVGFPGINRLAGNLNLNAGGLQYCVEDVEHLGLLEHDPAIQYRKEGIFGVHDSHAEWLYPVKRRISMMCQQNGITWGWFPENWAFGNGVTIHKTSASPEYKIVVHGTGLSLDQFLAQHGTTRLAELELERLHIRHEGWEKYEARWRPGTCPQEPHIVHLTWLITTHVLPEFAYQRLQAIIEDPVSQLKHTEHYLDRHFSASRKWDGKPSVHRGVPGGMG